ncbi:MAG: hypothetical protein ACKON8_12530 [Planctomycetota bacterium]
MTTPAPSALPAAGRPSATGVLKPQRARPCFGRHPWVLDSAVAAVDGTPDDGDVVDLATHDGRFIARGLWNPRSRAPRGAGRKTAGPAAA